MRTESDTSLKELFAAFARAGRLSEVVRGQQKGLRRQKRLIERLRREMDSHKAATRQAQAAHDRAGAKLREMRNDLAEIDARLRGMLAPFPVGPEVDIPGMLNFIATMMYALQPMEEHK